LSKFKKELKDFLEYVEELEMKVREAEMLFKNEELRILVYAFFISPLMVPFLLKYEAKT
jgi:hypothetical protein